MIPDASAMGLPENTLQSQCSAANALLMAQAFGAFKLGIPRLLKDFRVIFSIRRISLTPSDGEPCWNSAAALGVSFP
jgi:hypothetical protein